MGPFKLRLLLAHNSNASRVDGQDTKVVKGEPVEVKMDRRQLSPQPHDIVDG